MEKNSESSKFIFLELRKNNQSKTNPKPVLGDKRFPPFRKQTQGGIIRLSKKKLPNFIFF